MNPNAEICTVRWSDREVVELLNIWGDRNVQNHLKRTFRNHNIFEDIAEALKEKGIRKTAEQCRLKIKKFKSKYRSLKEQYENCPKSFARKAWQYYSLMDTIMGEQSSPANINDNHSEILRASLLKRPNQRLEADNEHFLSGLLSTPKDTPGASEASWPAVNSAQVVQRLKSGDLLSAPQSMTSRDTKPILPKPSTSAMTPPYLDSPQQTQQQQPRPQQPKTPKAAPKPKATVSQQPIVENDDSEPQQVCLRWNSFHSNMETMFPTLLYKEKFVDVTLACEGRIIKCHKVVLSSCSPYLERLLSDNPCKHPIILMPKDVPYWALRAIVDFMYRGEVNVEHEQLAPLLAAAESLQIKGLAGSPGGTGGKKDGRPAVKRKKSDLPAQAVQQKFIPQQSQAPSQPQQSTSSQPTTTAQSTKNKEDKESPAHKHPRMDPNIAESLRGLSPGIEITPLVSFEDIKSEPMDSNDEDGSLEPTEDYGIGKGYDDGEESLPVSHVESLMEEEDLGDESDTLNDHSQIPDPNDLLSTEMEPIDEDDSVNVYSENGMDFPDCGLSEEGTDLVESYPEVCMPSDPGEHDGS